MGCCPTKILTLIKTPSQGKIGIKLGGKFYPDGKISTHEAIRRI